ncbi:MAG: DegT/DnrJ/EryC1/StrS family aminotransferase [Actinomycetota bacterium]|nr:DegT/DnrJ/EryC1/StrS family aminotransferase [Actinomycetota bacterium]
MIPVVDLKAQYLEIKDELTAAVNQTLADGRFILGPNVAALEDEIAAFCGARFAVGVASGTDALHLALRALGVGPGDEVITTPFTFIATVEAISYCGAVPVFVDIDPATYNLDVGQIEAKITPRTRAILPVHLYGQPADMAEIMTLAGKYKLAVVEDCAQAIGAEYKDKRVGSIGNIGCLSFFPSKNLGGAGDGGMIVTDDEETAGRIRRLRAHGSSRKYYHEEIGYNSRLDELQAAVVRTKLKRLENWTAARRSRAGLYDTLLSELPGVKRPATGANRTHVWHQYTIRVKERDPIRERLANRGIDSAVHYPLPIHLQPAYADLGLVAGAYPQSELATTEVLSLPMYPQLSEKQVTYVCRTLAVAIERPIAVK